MSQLEQNTTSLDEVLAMVNALPNAGGGGGGGASMETGTLTVTDNGMFEPGINEYVLSSDNLKSSERLFISVETTNNVLILFVRNNTGENFYAKLGFTADSSAQFGIHGVVVENNSITVFGEISPSKAVYFSAI